MIMQIWGVHEFIILNTCNRIEVVAVASEETGRNGVLERLLGFDRLAPEEFYRKEGFAAFEHLALVTAGMLSQSPGECHVAAQVKAALDLGLRQGWSNGLMDEWVSVALHISKHIKREITPLIESTEIDALALQRLTNRSGHAMIIGTGVVGQRLVKGCMQKGYQCVWCYHRNQPAPDPDWSDPVEIIPWSELNLDSAVERGAEPQSSGPQRLPDRRPRTVQVRDRQSVSRCEPKHCISASTSTAGSRVSIRIMARVHVC